jgi:hypothetical protein
MEWKEWNGRNGRKKGVLLTFFSTMNKKMIYENKDILISQICSFVNKVYKFVNTIAIQKFPFKSL